MSTRAAHAPAVAGGRRLALAGPMAGIAQAGVTVTIPIAPLRVLPARRRSGLANLDMLGSWIGTVMGWLANENATTALELA